MLFKAKTKDTKEWVEGYVVLCDGKINPGQAYIAPTVTSILALEDWLGLRLGPFVEVDPETVCEYSGLNIDGNQVFENDKLSFWYYGREYTGYVTFIDGAFCVQCDVCAPYLDDVIFKRNAKIIGNFHDEEV